MLSSVDFLQHVRREPEVLVVIGSRPRLPGAGFLEEIHDVVRRICSDHVGQPADHAHQHQERREIGCRFLARTGRSFGTT